MTKPLTGNYAVSPVPLQSVVQRLVDLVVKGELSQGDSLPSVRELARKWGVGRNAVRDGLVQAQTLGLVEIRPRSGVVVRTVDYAPLMEALSQTLLVHLRQQEPSLIHLWDARAIIEVETAANAARRRVPEDLQELQQLLEQMQQLTAHRSKFVEADEKFHLAIARLGGNPVLGILLDALLKILRPDRLKTIPSETKMCETTATHEDIYKGIAEGNPERASAVMAEHCKRRIRYLLEP